MPDNNKWDVPARYIAEDRAAYFAKRGSQDGASFDKVHEEEFEYTLSDNDKLLDWAANNMVWKDVERYAEKVELKTVKPNYQQGWISGEREIIKK